MNCRLCGRPIPVSPTGRPRLYCSAACRQRAYRHRSAVSRHPDGLPGELVELAVRLRGNADLIALLARGWSPPSGATGLTLDRLVRDTARLAARLSDVATPLRDLDR